MLAPLFLPFFQGLGVSGGLIVAIGAQNAYVLTQSVRKNHHLPIILVCIVCECALIATGIAGVGTAVAANPALMGLATWGGAAFLGWYGLGAFRSAFRGGRLEVGEAANKSLRTALVGALAVTLLNPHAYLDTVVLLGSISGRFEGLGRYAFGAGAFTASVAWFLMLALFGRVLAPVFKRESAWRVLDALVGCTMWTIAASLVRQAL